MSVEFRKKRRHVSDNRAFVGYFLRRRNRLGTDALAKEHTVQQN